MIDEDAEQPILSDEAMARILASLPGAVPSEILNATAVLYRELTRRRSARTGRGLKADLKRVLRTAKAARDAIDAISIEGAGAMGLFSESVGHRFRISKLKTLKQDLIDVEDIAAVTLSRLRRPVIDKIALELVLAIHLLGTFYRRTTGLLITHSTNVDGEYSGQALSPFGQFATAFFREVDPAVPPSRIAHLIRRERDSLNEEMPD
jgi:hypothetical protein